MFNWGHFEMIRMHAGVSTILLVALLTASSLARRRETGFLDRTSRVAGRACRYQVFIPPNWAPRKKWPVILFLHGAGERGDDGLIQTEVGIGGAIRRFADRFPCVVVFPQCPKNRWWTEPEMARIALKTLDDTITEFNGDRLRVYLTGLSMGGYGTWSIAARHPQKFAALVPVCAGIRPPGVRASEGGSAGDPYGETADKVKSIPTWVFHGATDPVVPVSESRKMVEALKAAGGSVKYNEYQGVGHNSWDRAYADPDLIPWILSQRLRSLK